IYTLLPETRAHFFTGKLLAAFFLILLSIAQAKAQTNTASQLDVSNFSFTPTVIDTSNSSQAVSVTVRVTDVITDVSSVSVRFRSAADNQFLTINMNAQNRISGDSRDGVYRKDAIFPQGSKAGTWSVFEIIAFDISDYRNFYSSDFAVRGFPTDLQVI
ncbi:hypothetical protein G3V73_23795, partial [Escherichia coli]|nr:hypothetical protein [Escherichia coli]